MRWSLMIELNRRKNLAYYKTMENKKVLIIGGDLSSACLGLLKALELASNQANTEIAHCNCHDIPVPEDDFGCRDFETIKIEMPELSAPMLPTKLLPPPPTRSDRRKAERSSKKKWRKI
jgi:hypothetical protein